MEQLNGKILASTYKILSEIGAGGGGIIYLAEHLRLEKKVILKADKRSLKASITTLRREVDSLKNLNNQYIPKVYDFFEEDNVVYTVMDYIEGRSFDFYIKQKIKFSQADIIKWTKQILEALNYLHTRPPHGILHADIKPANIMLTPNNDAILIDFNIALAIGEDGAVAVGKSHGYASPEHYGLDYTNIRKNDYFSNFRKSSKSDITEKINKTALDQTEILINKTHIERTEILIHKTEVLETEILNRSKEISDSSSSSKKIKLDKRSDIYSLGATIYHILTGIKPAVNPFEVEVINKKEYSEEFIKIINKSMEADANKRYQSAEEMLRALRNIHKTDKRNRRLKIQTVTSIFFTSVFLVIGIGITFIGLRQKENLQKALTLAEYSSKALLDGDKELAIKYALESVNVEDGIFSPPITAEGQKTLTDALGVYDLLDNYKLDGILNLPSAPIHLEISDFSNNAIAMYSKEFIIFSIDTNEVLHTLKTGDSALYEARFLDENRLIYTSEDGIICFDIKNGQVIWKGDSGTNLSISGNGEVVATTYKDNDFADIYVTSTGEKIKSISFNERKQSIVVNDIFANPNDDIFELNYIGDKLGVSFGDGALWVYDVNNSNDDIELYDETSEYVLFDGGFYKQYFIFTSTNAEESLFIVIDLELLEHVGGFNSSNKFTVKVNDNDVYLQNENILVNIDPIDGDQAPLVTLDAFFTEFAIDENVTMIATKDSYILFDENANEITKIQKEKGSSFFDISSDNAIIGNFNENNIKNLRYYAYDDKNIFEYSTEHIHDEARVSKVYNTLMLFRYDNFILLDNRGIEIANIEIPNSDNVYDQQYRHDNNGDHLEVVYNDGKIIKYSAKDGSLLGEEFGEVPDKSLEEIFETDKHFIKSPLHGNPIVYTKDDVEAYKELESEGYLIYVYEVGENIILHYMTTDNYKYGLLVNKKFETLAYLPYLTDVISDKLIFDMPTGEIREEEIFNLGELEKLGREIIG